MTHDQSTRAQPALHRSGPAALASSARVTPINHPPHSARANE